MNMEQDHLNPDCMPSICHANYDIVISYHVLFNNLFYTKRFVECVKGNPLLQVKILTMTGLQWYVDHLMLIFRYQFDFHI